MKSAGRIRDADLDEVRQRADLIEVASDYMQVKKAGGRFKALCPFHAEKTPSLSLDPAKGLWVCFGCGEGGDAITLVQKLENLTFIETIERLARRFGVELHYEQLSSSDRAAHRRKLRLIEAHRAALDFYHDTLLRSPEAKDARAYLKGRGFTKETVQRFSVGFSPGTWDALVARLRSEKYTDQELTDAGLVSRTNDGHLVDRFRGRVMFPVFDISGDPVAFGARRMGDEDGPKYLNSAESPIYKKGHVLYGLHWAKGAIVKQGRALIVEGYTDVIALQAAGIDEAVATCGTALGIDHLKGLQRFTQELVLSLDADEAGGRAAERMYDQLIGEAQQLGLSAKVVLMPAGEDPADSVARDGGDAFRAMVDGAVPLLEFVLRREARRYAVGDPEVRARALTAGLRLLAKTQNEVVRMEYARRLSDWIKVDPNVIHVELEKVMRTGQLPRATTEAVLKRSTTQVRLEREAIKIALQEPALVKPHAEDTALDFFSVPAHRALWTEVAAGRDPGEAELDEDARRAYTQLSVEEVAGEITQRLVDEIFGRLKGMVVSRQVDELKARLQQINPVEDPDGHNALFGELIELERVKRSLSEGD